jgi:hypothetical protein
MRELALSAQTQAIFDRIKSYAWTLNVYGMSQIGRLSRKFGDKSLQMAASDLIDLYEAKSLDGDTLAAIALVIFGISGLP